MVCVWRKFRAKVRNFREWLEKSDKKSEKQQFYALQRKPFKSLCKISDFMQ